MSKYNQKEVIVIGNNPILIGICDDGGILDPCLYSGDRSGFYVRGVWDLSIEDNTIERQFGEFCGYIVLVEGELDSVYGGSVIKTLFDAQRILSERQEEIIKLREQYSYLIK